MPKLFRDTSVLPSLLFFILISSFGLALAPKDVYLAFSGQNYVYVPDSYHVADTGAFTAEFWMRLDATASDMYVVSKSNGGTSSHWYFSRSASTRRVTFTVKTSSSGSRSVSSSSGWASDKAWHHVAGVFNGSYIYLYLDGNLSASTSARGSMVQYEGIPICMGGRRASSTDECVGSFVGAIDEVRIWSRARTRTEIQSTMKAEIAGTESGLIAYWKMDEGSGGTLGDSSPGGNSAMLGSSPDVDAYDPVWFGSAPDTVPPAVSISSPVPDQLLSGIATFSASASDNLGVAGVQFQIDGTNTGAEVKSPPYSMSYNTVLLANTSHSVTAIARDLSNNKATATPVVFAVSNIAVVDTQPPSVAVTSPGTGQTISGTITISASASDNVAVAGVQFQLDGTNLGSERTSAPYAVSYDSKQLTNASHSLVALARDTSNNISVSPPITFFVSNVSAPGPTLSAITPTAAKNSVLITWNTTTKATTQLEYGLTALYDSLTTLNSTLATTHSVKISNLAAATTYHFRVYSKDGTGNLTVSPDYTFATAPSPVPCSETTYSFVSFSDSPQGMEGGIGLIMQDMWNFDPNIRMIVSNGDTNHLNDKRDYIDYYAKGHLNCGEPEFPWFPVMGNHNVDQDEDSLTWFTSTYANNWTADPSRSRLSRQLPGLTNFRRGPTQVLRSDGTISTIPNGSIYSFDYKNAHFAIINNFEVSNFDDHVFGVWDVNGPTVEDPANSQLDWLKQDLQMTSQPMKFVFSHVALVAPWYSLTASVMTNAGCIQWSEHQAYTPTDPSPFHTTELAKILADSHVTVIYRGHDHCPSRDLVDASNKKAFERSYLDAYNDANRPFGEPSKWQPLVGNGTVWQLDDGSVLNDVGFYTITNVTPGLVTIRTYRWDAPTGPTTLWDSFTIPVTTD